MNHYAIYITPLEDRVYVSADNLSIDTSGVAIFTKKHNSELGLSYSIVFVARDYAYIQETEH